MFHRLIVGLLVGSLPSITRLLKSIEDRLDQLIAQAWEEIDALDAEVDRLRKQRSDKLATLHVVHSVRHSIPKPDSVPTGPTLVEVDKAA